MPSSRSHQVTVGRTLREWWRDQRLRRHLISTGLEFLRRSWAFVHDSTPEQRRRRFGDADFDWDRRVNTTSGTVGWRERLVGAFTSGYQATEPALFHEMLDALPLDFREFTFLDLGSGKGRALLLASDYPFRRIIGVELLPGLHCVAQENLRNYKGAAQRCFALESICADARDFQFPNEPLLVYIFNPFLESILQQVVATLERSLAAHPRPVCILYHNPLLGGVITRRGIFAVISGTHQYLVMANTAARQLIEI